MLGRLADVRGLPLPCHLGAALVTGALGTLALAGTSHLALAAFSAAGLLGGVLYARLQSTTHPGPRHLLLLGAVFAACWSPLLAPCRAWCSWR